MVHRRVAARAAPVLLAAACAAAAVTARDLATRPPDAFAPSDLLAAADRAFDAWAYRETDAATSPGRLDDVARADARFQELFGTAVVALDPVCRGVPGSGARWIEARDALLAHLRRVGAL